MKFYCATHFSLALYSIVDNLTLRFNNLNEMKKVNFPFIFFIISLTCGYAQSKFPYPINTEYWEEVPALLPDSSMILMSNREGNRKCYRFVFDEDKWVLEPNSLTDKINSLLLTDKSFVYYLRFSPDFTHCFVTLKQFKEFWNYESKQVSGEWSLFKQILKNENSSEYTISLSYGPNNNSIYQNGNSDQGPNIILRKRSIDGFEVSDTIDFAQFQIDFTDEAIGIGEGLLVNASWKPNKFFAWIYTKKLASGQWTAPAKVNGIFGRGISLTSEGDTYVSSVDGDIYLHDSPPFILDEIAKSRVIPEPEITPTITVKKGTTTSNIVKPTGSYYALLIGISDYNNQDLQDLDNPVNDARKLKDVLVANYTFMDENVRVLENPNRAEFINELENLSKKVGEKDNLLIFYAGHGKFDANLNVGYWLAADATTTSKANWISNSTIRHYLAGVDSKHTLLISDACFSGSIFKTREVTNTLDNFGFARMYKFKSRKAITSGTLNTVPDESVFLHYLIKRLSENENQYLPAGWLFHDIEAAVIHNTSNIPQYGTIQNSGDEGGDFIFIRK